MRTLDWIVLAAAIVAIVVYGLYKGRRSRTTTEYLLAGRSVPWWAMGLSIMATQASGITFIGTTGQAYTDGMRFIQFYFGLPLAMVILSATLVPLFRRSGVFTAYEYLERRFDRKTRALTSIVFLIQRGLGVGLALYAPAVVLSVMLGWSEQWTILIMGVLMVGLTVFGGIKAVTWTDVQQMGIIFLGLFVSLGVAVLMLPPEVSFRDALYLAGVSGKLNTVDFSFDWRTRYNLWSGLIGGMFLALSYFGCDQSQVQRYLTGRSVSESRISLIFNAIIKVPMQFIVLLTGAMVFVFFVFEPPPMLFHRVERERVAALSEYRQVEANYQNAVSYRREAAHRLLGSRDPAARQGYLDAQRRFDAARKEGMQLAERSAGGREYNDTNYVFLTFVTSYLPAGLVGLILAAILVASTISAELNSLAASTVLDLYRQHWRPAAPDRHYVFVSRLATAFWGLYAVAFASFAGRMGSLIEAVNMVGSLFYGSVLGVFVLAFGVKRANGNGACLGLLAGLATVWWISRNTSISYLWYNVSGCLVVVAVGLLFSGSAARSTPSTGAVSPERAGHV
jgi:Na+/proline symporter